MPLLPLYWKHVLADYRCPSLPRKEWITLIQNTTTRDGAQYNLLFISTLFHISKKLPMFSNMNGKEEILAAMDQFERLQEKYLPKVDRKLIIDLFSRLREEPSDRPMYTIEAFFDEGSNPEEIRNEIIRLTGTAPQMHDRSTHIVTHHRLDYELLKQIQDNPKVREVTGTYMGSDASIGASHEPSTHDIRRASQSRNY